MDTQQQQQQTVSSGIHCKVATQSDTRRFFLESTQSYQQLAVYLCQLFGFSKDNATNNVDDHVISIKYTDDEGDFVTISSDEELNFARQHVGANGGVLRLVVSEKSNAEAPIVSEEIAHANFPESHHHHHHRGGRHGHQGRGWGHGYGHGPGFDHGSQGHVMFYGGHPGASENPWREKWARKQEKFLKKQEKFAQNPESLQQRIACISRKIQHLQSRLTELETAGPETVGKPHKQMFYRQKLQEKINFLSSRLEHLREVASRVPPVAGSVATPAENPIPSVAESQPVAEPLPSRDEVLRELDELESVATALRFSVREANLQLQLRRNDLQLAQFQLQNGADTSISKERIAELKALVVQAKELEQAKKMELKAHMQRTCAAKRQLKAIKMAEKGRKCDKVERKAAKDLMRQQKLANKAAKKEEMAAFGIPTSAPKNF